jgi:hypothetical protein
VYTWASFANDITTLMNGVNIMQTANTPTAVSMTYPAGNVPTYTAPTSGVIAASGQFIWGVNCGGPTGNGLNEFIFLPATAGVLGGATGGLASMVVDPSTGSISECDVIFDTAAPLTTWRGLATRNNSGLAHEVGHFWGLDHTNLHPGGIQTPGSPSVLNPTTVSLGTYASFNEVPAMTSSFTDTTAALAPTRNRVTGPWLWDDKAAFSLLYPVTSLANPAKRPLINESASIIGSVMDPVNSFGYNVFVIPHVGLPAPAMPTPGFPSVGTVSGTYRSEPKSVTGVSDARAGALSTGEFRLDGIPAGAPMDIALCLEPLGSLGLGFGATTNFGEWWYEASLNSLNNVPPGPLIASVAYTGFWNVALPVSSMRVAAGTIIRLDNAINMSVSGVQSLQVSRPLVEVSPRTFVPLGGTMTITVSHNRAIPGAGTPGSPRPWPLQSLTCT